MKLLTYRAGGRDVVGVLSADGKDAYPISQFGIAANSMQELIETASGDDLAAVRKKLAEGGAFDAVPYDRVEKRSPIPTVRRDMICIGFNFRKHAEEIAKLRGESADTANVSYPIYFSKRVLHATGDGDAVPYIPGYAENLDCGVEVCVVIGRDALNITPEETGDYIFGYTIANDMCDTRLNKVYTQPFLGKSLDGYMPVGPWIVTADEFPRDPVFDMKLTINGKPRQEGSTSDLVFSIPYIVSELSQNMTLKAGTMISTGSPVNIGAGDPEKLLIRPGDVMRCEIDGLGVLTNPVEEALL